MEELSEVCHLEAAQYRYLRDQRVLHILARWPREYMYTGTNVLENFDAYVCRTVLGDEGRTILRNIINSILIHLVSNSVLKKKKI